jgi:hypothetical protein
MQDIPTMLKQIERDLDAGTYHPGPWAEFVREANRRPQHERVALAEDITRVSNKLHCRNGRKTLPFPLAIGLEWLMAGVGVLLLRVALRRGSVLLLTLATNILAFTAQPVIKTSVGMLLGVRYAYSYAQGIEPRFKMRYGTYLAAPHWKRVLLHLSGTVGTSLALWLVARQAQPEFPKSALVCRVFVWVQTLVQLIPFLAALTNMERSHAINRMIRESSSGQAGSELRTALKRQ